MVKLVFAADQIVKDKGVFVDRFVFDQLFKVKQGFVLYMRSLFEASIHFVQQFQVVVFLELQHKCHHFVNGFFAKGYIWICKNDNKTIVF